MAREKRLLKELKMLKESPPSEISFWQEDDNMKKFEAVIFADDESAYKGGTFKLEIEVPDKYPLQPPKIRFMTPIYHPNIDSMGRICLDVLKMPPSGGWRPTLNLSTLLTSIRLLMSNPNPDDPLMPEIAEEFKINATLFEKNAQEWTKKYAVNGDHNKGKKRTLSGEDK